MNTQSLIETDARARHRERVDQLKADIEDLERRWDEADDQVHKSHLKPGINKKLADKRRWLKLYQAAD